MKSTLALLLFGLLLCGCAHQSALSTRESQRDDIFQAVFLWQFGNNGSGMQFGAKVYFIAVGEKGGDPSDKFMKRFAGLTIPVRKASASHFVPDVGLLDKKTGKQGLEFLVENIKWISDTEVQVSGGYFEGETSASGNVYTLKKVNGKWQVIKDEMKWIS